LKLTCVGSVHHRETRPREVTEGDDPGGFCAASYASASPMCVACAMG
jgi:hypothetical protein